MTTTTALPAPAAFYETKGHGYYEVDAAHIVTACFEHGMKAPSRFSYFSKATGCFYLEEDVDAPAYFAAAGLDFASTAARLPYLKRGLPSGARRIAW